MLQNCKTRGSTEDNISSLAKGIANVRLVNSDSNGLFDTSVSPFDLFHHHERLHQERHGQVQGCFILPCFKPHLLDCMAFLLLFLMVAVAVDRGFIKVPWIRIGFYPTCFV